MPIPDKYAHPVLPRTAQDEAFDKHRAGLVVVMWDRETPINGVPQEHWLGRCHLGPRAPHPDCSSPRRDTPAEGDIYLIQDPEGHTMVFQPHHPSGGPMLRDGEGKRVGNDHADRLAAERAIQELTPRPAG